jgi:hypothetical protein
MTTGEDDRIAPAAPGAPKLLDEVSALKYVTVEHAPTYRAIV